jgi:transmembrane sensor
LLIDRSAARVWVHVFEGVVLVRGERVPERVRRLSSGESVEIDTHAERPSGLATSAPLVDAPTRQPAATDAPAIAGSTPATAARTPSVTWRELAQNGHYGGAYRALGTQGIRRESRRGGVEQLLMLADIARLSGNPADAAIPLARIVRDHPGDPRAAFSAFTLGRLELDTLGQPAQAAASFRSG